MFRHRSRRAACPRLETGLMCAAMILLQRLAALLGSVLAVVVCLTFSAGAQQASPQTSPDLFAGLRWRNIGPANMGGRTTDIAGISIKRSGMKSKRRYGVRSFGGVTKGIKRIHHTR